MPFPDSTGTRSVAPTRTPGAGERGSTPEDPQETRRGFRFPTSALPGLAVCLAGAVLAWGLAQLLPGISPLLVAILAGALWRNLAPVPALLAPGVAIAAKRLLRTGIVLLGLHVSLASVLGLGFGVLVVVVASVAVTFLGTLWIGARLGISPAQRLLIASGFSICGAAAVAGMDGVVKAKEEEVATGIALVVLFGTLMIPLVPFLGGLLGLPEEALGIWIGASTHEVAQVVAAGGAVGGGALAFAVTVKLARVLMLAPMAAGVSIHLRRQQRRAVTAGGLGVDGGSGAASTTDSADAAGSAGSAGSTGSARSATSRRAARQATKRTPIVPLFVLGFVAAMILRTAGFLPETALDVVQILQTLLLSAAMFALGLGVHLKSLIQVGYRPVLLGLLSTVVILGISLGGIAALGL
ncbi:putative sulfate exporter family transporter [Cellulosimicrobium funkei]|nr:putative sulfate exporter family transporter [Cellulosimicrobium funkei]